MILRGRVMDGLDWLDGLDGLSEEEEEEEEEERNKGRGGKTRRGEVNAMADGYKPLAWDESAYPSPNKSFNREVASSPLAKASCRVDRICLIQLRTKRRC